MVVVVSLMKVLSHKWKTFPPVHVMHMSFVSMVQGK